MRIYPDQILHKMISGVEEATNKLVDINIAKLIEIVKTAEKDMKLDNEVYYNPRPTGFFSFLSRRIPTEKGYEAFAAHNILLDCLGKDKYLALWDEWLPNIFREKFKGLDSPARDGVLRDLSPEDKGLSKKGFDHYAAD